MRTFIVVFLAAIGLIFLFQGLSLFARKIVADANRRRHRLFGPEVDRWL